MNALAEKTGKEISSTSLLKLDALVGLVFAARRISVLVAVSGALETLHLPRLQSAQVLLAHVDAADLVAHKIHVDVLLRPCLRVGGSRR